MHVLTSRPQEAFVIRPGVLEDNDFIAKSWAETFRWSEHWVACISPGRFARCVYPAIRRILERAQVRVAAPPNDDTTVYGFAVLEPDVVHCVYVRIAWRRIGIARELLHGLELAKMDWGTQSRDWLLWARKKKAFSMKNYRPFFMYEGE